MNYTRIYSHSIFCSLYAPEQISISITLHLFFISPLTTLVGIAFINCSFKSYWIDNLWDPLITVCLMILSCWNWDYEFLAHNYRNEGQFHHKYQGCVIATRHHCWCSHLSIAQVSFVHIVPFKSYSFCTSFYSLELHQQV